MGFPRRRATLSLTEVLVIAAYLVLLTISLLPLLKAFKLRGRGHPNSAQITNIKQISISLLMYGGDNDDRFVIAGQWHSADPDAFRGYSSSWYLPWTGVVFAYLKSTDVLYSPRVEETAPFTKPGIDGCQNERQCALLYPSFGYNAVYLSPTYGKGPFSMKALSMVSVAKPAEQVMLTEIWSPMRTSFGAIGDGPDNAYMTFGTAEAPDGATNPGPNRPIGRLSWGSYNSSVTSKILTIEEGKYQAGVAFRYQDRTPIVFADGHSKTFTPEALAVGTDWVSGLTVKAQNLHDGKYLWDPSGK